MKQGHFILKLKLEGGTNVYRFTATTNAAAKLQAVKRELAYGAENVAVYKFSHKFQCFDGDSYETYLLFTGEGGRGMHTLPESAYEYLPTLESLQDEEEGKKNDGRLSDSAPRHARLVKPDEEPGRDQAVVH